MYCRTLRDIYLVLAINILLNSLKQTIVLKNINSRSLINLIDPVQHSNILTSFNNKF